MTECKAITAVAAAWVSLVAMGASYVVGLRVNASESMPQGIWMQHAYTGSVRVGDAVVICLPKTTITMRYIGPGSCNNGTEPVLKTVGAVPGDVVSIAAEGVVVNGQWLPNMASLPADEAGRPLTPFRLTAYRVQPGQLFLFSAHSPRSFDSRYLGPVDVSLVIATANPVLTLK